MFQCVETLVSQTSHCSYYAEHNKSGPVSADRILKQSFGDQQEIAAENPG